jgi:hypothetical protein
MIQIEKTNGGYLAHATPPHVKAEWRTTAPVTAASIIAALTERGAHQTDIGDAFYSADPDWLK